MPAYKFTPRVVVSPDAPQKPLVRKRARPGGANWVRVTRERSPSKAKKFAQPVHSNPHAPTMHQILTSAEATAFSSQFGDRKIHPTKASQHEFLAMCIDVDLTVEKVHQPLWRGVTMMTIRTGNNEWSKLCGACFVYLLPFAAL